MNSPSSRINLIQEIRSKLTPLLFADLELVLTEFGLGEIDYSTWIDDTENVAITRLLGKCDDSKLLSVTSWLKADLPSARGEVESEDPAVPATRIFISHSSTVSRGASEIADALRSFGFNAFVAHMSIQPDALWRKEIVSELDRADAGVAILTPEFRSSDWCSQEVGWLQGRHVPIITLNCGLAPYGPLGERQGVAAQNLDAIAIAETVTDILHRRPDLRPKLATSYVIGMSKSRNFASTDRIWQRLRQLRNLTTDQCTQLKGAVNSNKQVYLAHSPHDEGRRYKEVIPEFLDSQPRFNPRPT